MNLGLSENIENYYKWEKEIKNYPSATKLFNYFLDDPLLDYLDKYGSELGYIQEECSFETNLIMEKGHIFESNVIAKIREKGIQVIEVCEYENWIDGIFETIQLIKQGIPIIAQGYLVNHINQTKGRPDILIRSDFLNLLKDGIIQTEEIEIKGDIENGNQWHYRVIDIKMSNILLSSNGVNIINNKIYKAYKAQVLVYNLALSLIQGYFPQQAYLLGRSSHNSDNSISFSDCFNSISIIDYSSYDEDFIDKLEKGLEWLKLVKQLPIVSISGNGSEKENKKNWDELESILPKHFEFNLRPNMKNKYDYKWNLAKKEIANEREEFTLLWNCGVSKRNKLLNNGIKTWNEYKNYCMLNDGFIDKTLYHILDINSLENKKLYSPDKNKLDDEFLEYIPEKGKPFVVIDFETSNNLNDDFEFLPEKGGSEYIFLIGITVVIPNQNQNNEPEYRYFPFMIKQLNLDYELSIVHKMCKLIKDLLELLNLDTITFYHWSPAEVRFMNNMLDRQWDELSDDDHNILQKVNYSDILSVFKYQPIVVKGAYNFSIKTIGTALYNLGLIKTTWDKKLDLNGFAVMLQINQFNSQAERLELSLRDYEEVKDIIIYNMVDCQVLAEIIIFLQNTYL